MYILASGPELQAVSWLCHFRGIFFLKGCDPIKTSLVVKGEDHSHLVYWVEESLASFTVITVYSAGSDPLLLLNYSMG